VKRFVTILSIKKEGSKTSNKNKKETERTILEKILVKREKETTGVLRKPYSGWHFLVEGQWGELKTGKTRVR